MRVKDESIFIKIALLASFIHLYVVSNIVSASESCPWFVGYTNLKTFRNFKVIIVSTEFLGDTFVAFLNGPS